MLRKIVLSLSAVLLVGGLAQAALSLDVTPDHVADGTVVTLQVTGAGMTDFVFLAAGPELGQTSIPLGTTTLDLGLAQPFAILPLGTGDVAVQVTVPVVPPPLVGQTLHLQAFSVGFEFLPPNPPSLSADVSNLDAVSF